MALADIVRQLAYFKSGGRPEGKKTDAEDAGGLLSALGSIPVNYEAGRDIAAKRAMTKRVMTPISDYGLFSKEEIPQGFGNLTLSEAKTAADLKKDLAAADSLGTVLYLNLKNGEISNTPEPGFEPMPRARALAQAASFGKTYIASGAASQRQEKSQGFQEGMKEREEQRQAAREAEKTSAAQEGAIKKFSGLKDLIGSYYKELDKLSPSNDSMVGAAKRTGKQALSQVPIVGTSFQPNLAAFEKFRQGIKPLIAKGLENVGALTEQEQQSALNLLADPTSSVTERQKSLALIEDILFKAQEKGIGAVRQERETRAQGFLNRVQGSPPVPKRGSTVFPSAGAVKSAVARGELSPQEAKQVLVDQFGFE